MNMRMPIWPAGLPLKAKLFAAAALLMLALFLAYNFAQYFLLKQWLLTMEKTAIQEKMVELKDHFSNNEIIDDPVLLERQQSFIKSINQHDQMVRVLDSSAKPVLTVTDGVSEQSVPPAAAALNKMIYVASGNEGILILRSPLVTPHFQGTIEIVNNLRTFGKLHNVMLMVLLLGGGIAIGASGLGGWLVARQMLRPVQRLSDAMTRAKENGFRERVEHVANGDELSRLAGLFNVLMDRVELALRQQQQFVEDASHELKTPIAIMEGHLSMLEQWGKRNPDVLEESLHTLMQQQARLKGVMQELLALTRAESVNSPSEVAPLYIHNVVLETVESLAALYPDFSFHINLAELHGVQVRIEQRHLEQILLILLDNAVKYSAERKCITVAGELGSGNVLIRIQDQGIGVEEEHLPRLFDRFYRVDQARTRERGGTGLGLSIAKRFVENYAGTIGIASKPKEGTTVVISLPVAAAYQRAFT